MVPRERLAALNETTTMPDVMRVVASSPYSRLPVFRNTLDDIVGILHTKEAVLHFVDQGSKGSLMALVRPIPRVPDTMPADRLLAFLRERRSHQAIVADAPGRVAGLITLEDVLGELLGNVADEFKGQRLLPLRLTDGRVRLPGAFPMDRSRVWVDGAWPQNSGTVGEFVAHEAGRIPEPGERADHRWSRGGDRSRRERLDRVADRVAAAARRRRRMTTLHRHRGADRPERGVRRGGVRHRRRAAGGDRRARGQEAAVSLDSFRGCCTTRQSRTATLPRRRSASRSPASVSACTASTCSPTGSRRARRTPPGPAWLRGARIRQRRRGRHPHLLPHRPRRDGAEITGAARRRADRPLDHAADVVDPDARCCRSSLRSTHRQRAC